MPPKVWIPQPATKLYGAGGADPESLRDRLVDSYGEGSVERAEISVVLDLLMISGIIKPSEFIDLMQKKLYRIDQKRRAAAGLDIDRG